MAIYTGLVSYALLLQVVFGGCHPSDLVDRAAVETGFHVSGLNFSTPMAHLTDGSKRMEDFFREIGEEVYVPQVSLFFSRDVGGCPLTVPNVHPADGRCRRKPPEPA